MELTNEELAMIKSCLSMLEWEKIQELTNEPETVVNLEQVQVLIDKVRLEQVKRGLR